jgi:hypothetical protein
VRTQAGAEVVLTVEGLRGIAGPGGAADLETAVTFHGDGEGARDGALTSAGPAVAGRWVGSGRHAGRLTFALRSAVPGSYTLPIRFVLTAP